MMLFSLLAVAEQIKSALDDKGAILLRQFADGDRDAFDKLVAMYEKFVFSTVFLTVKNKDDAFDVSQEVFIKVFRFADKFKNESLFSSWLYKICKTTSYDFLRKKSKGNTFSANAPLFDNEDVEFDIPDISDSSNPEKLLMKKELCLTVREAINSLSEEHREIIVLRDIDGFSYSEIALILNISEGTVKSRISRAREILRKELSGKL